MNHDKNPNPLGDRRKAQEEEYFRQQNAALAAKMKARLELENAGISDQNLIDELGKAGFTADSVRALFLVPVIQVAWADGRIQEEERNAILQLVDQRGIEKESEAYHLISTWLLSEPTDEKFMQAKILVEPFVEESQRAGSANAGDWIIQSARQVAEATGGIFGIGSKVSREEEDFLRQISARFDKSKI